MQDDLMKVAETIVLARRTMGVIRFNIAFALGLKAIFLVLTLTGQATLWFAILADTGATLLVVANALRLLR
jgi:Cd2+/Zn2+-exporting ATPase